MIERTDQLAGTAPDEPLLTIKQAVGLFHEALGSAAPRERTVYDWGEQGKLRAVRVGKRGLRTTRSWVTARVRELQAPPPPVVAGPGAPPEPPDPVELRSLTSVAHFVLGDDAAEAAVLSLSAEVREYRLNMQRLHPQARTMLVRKYFRAVKKAVAELEEMGPGLLVACAVIALGALAG